MENGRLCRFEGNPWRSEIEIPAHGAHSANALQEENTIFRLEMKASWREARKRLGQFRVGGTEHTSHGGGGGGGGFEVNKYKISALLFWLLLLLLERGEEERRGGPKSRLNKGFLHRLQHLDASCGRGSRGKKQRAICLPSDFPFVDQR